MGSACFSVSSFFSFVLIAVNTVMNVSTNNNINSNMFMAVTPRQLSSYMLDTFQKANTKVLDRIQNIVRVEPGCGKIVKCDLLSLVKSVNPPPMVTRILGLLAPDECSSPGLACSLLE